METSKPNTSEQKPEEKKIVNLFEDMNHHEHDEVSYNKMKKVPENNEDVKSFT